MDICTQPIFSRTLLLAEAVAGRAASMSSGRKVVTAIADQYCRISFQRPRLLPASRLWATQNIRQDSSSSKLRPRITEPSIWKSIIPKFLRSDGKATPSAIAAPSTARPPQPLNYNPLAVYIVLFLLIGSNAINIVGLRNEVHDNRRATDAKIDLLKEVIQRVHKGEDVDVAAALGTGNEKDEEEWEAVIREIEKEDQVPDRWRQKAKPTKSTPPGGPGEAEPAPTNQPPKAALDDNQQAKVVKSARWF